MAGERRDGGDIGERATPIERVSEAGWMPSGRSSLQFRLPGGEAGPSDEGGLPIRGFGADTPAFLMRSAPRISSGED